MAKICNPKLTRTPSSGDILKKNGAQPMPESPSGQISGLHQINLSQLGNLSAAELMSPLSDLRLSSGLSPVLSWQRTHNQQIIGIVSPWRCKGQNNNTVNWQTLHAVLTGCNLTSAGCTLTWIVRISKGFDCVSSHRLE